MVSKHLQYPSLSKILEPLPAMSLHLAITWSLEAALTQVRFANRPHVSPHYPLSQPVRLLVSARVYQSANSIFLS